MENKKSKFRLWHGLAIAIVVLGIAKTNITAVAVDTALICNTADTEEICAMRESAGCSWIASESRCEQTSTPLFETNPLKAWEADRATGQRVPDRVKTPEAGTLDEVSDIILGPRAPASKPGQPAQPIPAFSGINAPFVLSHSGPVQIADDVRFLGLTDLRVGLANTGPSITSPLELPKITVTTPTGYPQEQSVIPGTPLVNLGKITLSLNYAPSVRISKLTFLEYGTATAIKNPMTRLELIEGDIGTGTTRGILTVTTGPRDAMTLTLTTPLTLNSGSPKTFQLIGDIDPAFLAYGQFYIHVTNVETVDASGTPLSVDVANVPHRLNTINLINPDLEVKLAARSPGAGSLLPGAAWTTLAEFELKNKGYSGYLDARITTLTISKIGNDTGSARELTNIRLIDSTDPANPVVLGTGGVGTSITLSPAVTISPQNSKFITVQAVAISNPADTGDTLGVSIAAGPSITVSPASHTPAGLFPVNGNLFTIQPFPTLTVSLAGDNPAASNVMNKTNSFIPTKFTFTASNGPITVSQIKLTRSGTADSTELENLKLFEGATQLGSTITSLGASPHAFSGFSLTIPVGTSKTITVQTDVKSGARTGKTFSFSVAAAADITVNTAASQIVSGTFPVNGNAHTIAPRILAELDPGTPAAGTVYAGNNGVGVAKFKLTSQNNPLGSNDNDITRFTITRIDGNGATTGSVMTIDVVVDGVTYSNISRRGTDLHKYDVTLPTPVRISEGQTKQILVKANLSTNATHNGTIQFSIDRGLDVTATLPDGSASLVGGSFPILGNTFTMFAPSIEFDAASYTLAQSPFITFVYPPGNTNTSTVQTVTTKVYSSSDSTGFNLTLTETGTNTGIFANNITLTTGTSNSTSRILKTACGGTINVQYPSSGTATYSDSATITCPDLVIGSLTVPATVNTGDSIEITATVNNSGTGAAGTSNLRFCLNNSNCLTTTTGRIVSDISIGALPAGSTSSTRTISWTAATGTHTIYACADTGATVAESNEGTTSNCTSANIIVKVKADIHCSGAPPPPAGHSSTTPEIHFTWSNPGYTRHVHVKRCTVSAGSSTCDPDASGSIIHSAYSTSFADSSLISGALYAYKFYYHFITHTGSETVYPAPTDFDGIIDRYTIQVCPGDAAIGGGIGGGGDLGGLSGPNVLGTDLFDGTWDSLFQTSVLTPFVETAKAVAGDVVINGIGFTSPVTVFDDFYIAGNSATEPGNVVVQGKFSGSDGIETTGPLESTAGINTTGSSMFPNRIIGDMQIVGGDVQFGGYLYSVNGKITATGGGSIGRFNVLTSGAQNAALNGTDFLPRFGTAGIGINSVSCPAEDVLVSCFGAFASTPALGGGASQNAWFTDSKMTGNLCEVRANKEDSGTMNFYAKAVCFSPNGN